MSEYIMESVPLPRIREESQLVMRGEIVRCKDCKHFHASTINHTHTWCARLLDMYGNSLTFNAKPEDYCAWGERREGWTTCKCGEEIELGDRESAVCPSCGRTVRE